MFCPTINELPPPPAGRTGWPWTKQSELPQGSENRSAWPRITIVTPSYNQGEYLEETIRSVLLQGYPDLEYFVFDGGSTDGSPEIIEKYSRWLSSSTSAPDAGQSDAVNRGMHRGTGVFAGWINSDDLLCRNALLGLATEALEDTGVVHIGVCCHIDGTGGLLAFHQGRVHTVEEILNVRSVWRSGGFIDQPAVLFPRDLFLRVGGLDVANHFTMDYDLWGKFLLAGSEFKYCRTRVGTFRVHEGQKTGQGLRQTDALVESAKCLLARAGCVPDGERARILRDLLSYQADFRKAHWRGTGRLARLPLPPAVINSIRKVYSFVAQAK